MNDPRDDWQRACERLGLLGERIAAADPAGGDAVDGFEHLVDQTVLWLAWAVLHPDPGRPFFQRRNDLVSQWGGPNADNVYRHARIDPARRYVVRGRMHSCDEFLVAVRAGFMHRPTWGTLAQVSASDMGISRGAGFELFFGGDRPGAITLPAEAVMISVREYYLDWTADEPATFTIECLDPEPHAELTPHRFGERLDEALDEVTDSIRYWNEYLSDRRVERVDNSFGATTGAVAKGLSNARYEFSFWDLADGEALIIECDVPDARYWSVQLYALATFEPLDLFGSITSRNHRQSVVSADGRVRFVLAATDPGTPNWLDTGGRREGLCTLRWFWPHSDARPQVRAEVAPLGSVGSVLPAGTPQVTSEERASELAARQAHLRWRFRT